MAGGAISQYSSLTIARERGAYILTTSVSFDWTVADDMFFSPIGQEYPFLQVSEIFLSRPAVSA